jgi:uncharacterized damage-inducible protein DinB
MAIAQTLLPEFDHEMAGCRKSLERIPQNQFGYQPHPKSFTMSQLATHLASIPSWLAGTMTTTEMDFADPEIRASIPAPATTREALLELFDRGLAEGRAILEKTSDADFAVIWSGKNAGQVVFAMPRIGVYRTMIMNHAIHHRAQLCVYLRMLNVPVPALYGPSADESN